VVHCMCCVDNKHYMAQHWSEFATLSAGYLLTIIKSIPIRWRWRFRMRKHSDKSDEVQMTYIIAKEEAAVVS